MTPLLRFEIRTRNTQAPRTANPRTASPRDPEPDHDHVFRHRLRRPHSDREIPRRAQGLHRAPARRAGGARGGGARGHRPGPGGRMHHGQRHPGRQRTEPGAPGGAQRRAARARRRDDDQQGLRLGTESRDARGTGHRHRRHRDCGRRRHGVDEQRAVSAAPGARRVAHGQRAARRLAGARRAVVQRSSSATWGCRARSSPSCIRSAAPSRTPTPRRATGRPPTPPIRDGSPTRSCRSTCRGRRARRSSSIETRRSATTPRRRRSPP